LLLLLTLGVMVPVLLSHFFSARSVAASMDSLIRQELSNGATVAASRIDDRMRWMVDGLGLVIESVPFESFPRQKLHDTLAIPYRQLSGATMVALLDERGKAVAQPYRPGDEEARLLGRERVTDADVQTFAKSVPLDLSLKAHVAIGPIHSSSEGTPRVVAAASFPVAGTEERWVLAVEYSLSSVCEMLLDGEMGEEAELVDGRGYSLCERWGDAPARATDAEDLLEAEIGVREVAREHGAVLRAVDEVDLTGWRVSIVQKKTEVMAPVREALTVTAVWVGVAILIAAIGGMILARGLSGPISDLEAAARKVAAGDYDQKLRAGSRDEIGNLASAFNSMSEEIRAWNAELTDRVEEKTRELKEAQAQILQTQKLAAVGELGAGVAHEINNPLTGVIGEAQLLKAEAEPGSQTAASLDEIITSARRVAEVVHELLRYSQTRISPDMRPVDLKEVLEKSVWMFEGRFEENGIRVAWEAEAGCQVNGIEDDLRIAMNNILENALKAMPEGGEIRLEVARVEGGAVRVTVRDEGVGMTSEERERALDPFFTTAAPGSGSRGLGLATVHRVVESHEGRIVIDSQVGKGTSVTLFLPGHLRISKS